MDCVICCGFEWANGVEPTYFANLDYITRKPGGTFWIHNKDCALRFPNEESARAVCELLAVGERPRHAQRNFYLLDSISGKALGCYHFKNEPKKMTPCEKSPR